MVQDLFIYVIVIECLFWVESILDVGYIQMNKVDVVFVFIVREVDIN